MKITISLGQSCHKSKEEINIYSFICHTICLQIEIFIASEIKALSQNVAVLKTSPVYA